MNRGTLDNFFLGVQPYLKKFVMDGYGEDDLVHEKIFRVETTDKPFVHEAVISGLGLMSQSEEEQAAPLDKMYQGPNKKYTMLKYRLGVPYSTEMWEDDEYGVMKKLATMLGKSGQATLETLASNILLNAFATNGPDGVPLCSVSHPLYGSGGLGINTFSAMKQLSYSSLQDGLTVMRQTKNNRSIPDSKKPAFLVVPSQLEFIALAILNSVGRPDTADREDNVIKDRNLKVVVWSYLDAAPNSWFLFSSPTEHELKKIVRIPFSTTENPDYDNDRITQYSRMRQDFGWTDWRGIFGNPNS